MVAWITHPLLAVAPLLLQDPSVQIRWSKLPLCVAQGLPIQSSLPQDTGPLFEDRDLRRLSRCVVDLHKAGLEDLAQEARRHLERLGAGEGALKRVSSSLERPAPSRAASAAKLVKVRRDLVKAVQPLDRALVAIEPAERRAEAAELLLSIDGSLPKARSIAGFTGRADGDGWIHRDDAPLHARRARIYEAIQELRSRQPEVTATAATHELFEELGLDGGRKYECGGLTLETTRPASHATRILHGALRSMALSNLLLTDEELRFPPPLPEFTEHHFVMFETAELFDRAFQIDEAKDNVLYGDGRLSAYVTRSGVNVSYQFSTVIATGHFICYAAGGAHKDLGEHAGVPEPLAAGHMGWIMLSVAGCSWPVFVEDLASGAEGQSAAAPGVWSLEELRSAGLMGSRAWLREQARRRIDPPWSASFKASFARLGEIPLLKAIFMAQYLHELGPLEPRMRRAQTELEARWIDLTEAFPELATGGEAGDKRFIELYMAELAGGSIVEFEASWRRWLIEDPYDRSLVSRIGSPEDERGSGSEVTEYLSEIRRATVEARLSAAIKEGISSPAVSLSAGLSRGAQRHAGYLAKHRKQLQAWPDAHEEYPELSEFTPEGCWAGMHSVICPDVESPRAAIDSWMGTFFHRLPLLDPGLKQVGWALEKGVAILDCTSIVDPTPEAGRRIVQWPPAGAERVPCSFNPELPNPFPGEDQGSWGYPVTVQWTYGPAPVRFELRRADASGPAVEARLSTPEAPGNDQHVPTNAWCLIPKEPLEPKSTYWVEIEWSDGTTSSSSFRTASP